MFLIFIIASYYFYKIIQYLKNNISIYQHSLNLFIVLNNVFFNFEKIKKTDFNCYCIEITIVFKLKI